MSFKWSSFLSAPLAVDKAAQADGGGLWPGDILAANWPKAMTPLCVRANLPGRVVVATLPADKRRQAHQDMIPCVSLTMPTASIRQHFGDTNNKAKNNKASTLTVR